MPPPHDAPSIVRPHPAGLPSVSSTLQQILAERAQLKKESRLQRERAPPPPREIAVASNPVRPSSGATMGPRHPPTPPVSDMSTMPRSVTAESFPSSTASLSVPSSPTSASFSSPASSACGGGGSMSASTSCASGLGSSGGCSTLEANEYRPVIVEAVRRPLGPPSPGSPHETDASTDGAIRRWPSAPRKVSIPTIQTSPLASTSSLPLDSPASLTSASSPIIPAPSFNSRIPPPPASTPSDLTAPPSPSSPVGEPESPQVPGLGRMRSFLGPKVRKLSSPPWNEDPALAPDAEEPFADLPKLSPQLAAEPRPGGFTERKLSGKKSLTRLLVPSSSSPIPSAASVLSASTASPASPYERPKLVSLPPSSPRPSLQSLPSSGARSLPGLTVNSHSLPALTTQRSPSPGTSSFVTASSGESASCYVSASASPTTPTISAPAQGFAARPTLRPREGSLSLSSFYASRMVPPGTSVEPPLPRSIPFGAPSSTSVPSRPPQPPRSAPLAPSPSLEGASRLAPSSSAGSTTTSEALSRSWSGDSAASPSTERSPLPSGGAWVSSDTSTSPVDKSRDAAGPKRRHLSYAPGTVAESTIDSVHLARIRGQPLPQPATAEGKGSKTLKNKKSGFFKGLKKAVGAGGDDVRNLVSAPVGNVVRNGGNDPLPPSRSLKSISPQLAATSDPTRRPPPSPGTLHVPSFAFDPPRSGATTPVAPSSDESARTASGGGGGGAGAQLRVKPSLSLRPVSMTFSAGFDPDFMAGGASSGDDGDGSVTDDDEADTKCGGDAQSVHSSATESSFSKNAGSISDRDASLFAVPMTPRTPATPATTVASLLTTSSSPLGRSIPAFSGIDAIVPPGSAPPSQPNFPAAVRREDPTSARRRWKVELWELEKQAKLLRAEIDGLRAEKGQLMMVASAGRVPRSSSLPCRHCGCSGLCAAGKHSLFDRPRVKGANLSFGGSRE